MPAHRPDPGVAPLTTRARARGDPVVQALPKAEKKRARAMQDATNQEPTPPGKNGKGKGSKGAPAPTTQTPLAPDAGPVAPFAQKTKKGEGVGVAGAVDPPHTKVVAPSSAGNGSEDTTATPDEGESGDKSTEDDGANVNTAAKPAKTTQELANADDATDAQTTDKSEDTAKNGKDVLLNASTNKSKNAEKNGKDVLVDAPEKLDFDLDFLENDLLAASIEDGDEESAPGPLPKVLQDIWDAFMTKLAGFVVSFSRASRKATALLWALIGDHFKLSRSPNLYNMWVKKWSLINEMRAGETKAEYHRRYVDAYHEELDAMTPADRKKLRVDLLAWLRDYEKECAREADERGQGFKGVLDAKRAMAQLAQEWAVKANVVILGVVAPTKVGDPKQVAVSGSFASHPEAIGLVEDLGVNMDELTGDLAACFGAQRIANRLLDDWSDKALREVLAKPEKDRRYYLRRALLAILNETLDIAVSTLKWKGNASANIQRGFWCKNWPRGVLTPDEMGDNKYPEDQHNILHDATYKTLRKEPGFKAIELVRFTPEQLSWRRTDWKRWCALPAYMDTAGYTLISVGDVMPSESADIKNKGRATRIKFSVNGAKIEGDEGMPELEDNTPESDNDDATDNGKRKKKTRKGKATLSGAATKKPRRSEEDYTTLLVGGGSAEAWTIKEVPPLKPRPSYPGYVDVEPMDVVDDDLHGRAPSAGPSDRSQMLAPASALSLEAIQAQLQAQLLENQRIQNAQSQQMLSALLAQAMARPPPQSQWQNYAQALEQQQLQLPPLPNQWTSQLSQQQVPQQQAFQQQAFQQQAQSFGMPNLDDMIPDGRGGILPRPGRNDA